MQVKMYNRHAKRKFDEIVRALHGVNEAMIASTSLLKSYDPAACASDTIWSTPGTDELRASHDRAVRELDMFRKATRRYEAELISRDWRIL